MRRLHISDRGQILIIFVFAIIGLIAISGLAVDGGNAYADRRNAQNAADSAALLGAVTRTNLEKAVKGANAGDCSYIPIPPPLGGYGACASAVVTKAKDLASLNGYNDDKSSNTVSVYTPPIDGPYSPANCSGSCTPSDYIQVIIETNLDTYFARIVGITRLHNKVEAVALARYVPQKDLYGGASLVQLDSSGCGFDLGGNASMTLNGGGIFVNSSDRSCAFEQNPCKIFKLNDGATLKAVGKVDSKCTPPPPSTTVPLSGQYDFPPIPPLTQPAECSGPAKSTKKGGIPYSPGHYDNIPPGTLAKGVYCVDQLVTQNSDTVNGTAGVFIYVKNGGFRMDGGTVKLVAPSTGPYAGYAVYYYPATRDKNCTLNGGSAQTLTGQVYLPNCDLTINGDTSATGLTTQIVAATFKWTGNSVNVFNDAAGKIPQTPEINQTGLYH